MEKIPKKGRRYPPLSSSSVRETPFEVLGTPADLLLLTCSSSLSTCTLIFDQILLATSSTFLLRVESREEGRAAKIPKKGRCCPPLSSSGPASLRKSSFS